MHESDLHLASAVAGSLVNHPNAGSGSVSDSGFDVVYANCHMLDARAVLGNVLADRAIAVLGDVNEELDEGLAAGNENGSNALLLNYFGTGGLQAEHLGVDFSSFVKSAFAGDAYVVNTDSLERKFPIKR